MTSRQENAHIDSAIDRRLFLGAAGALTLAAQPALAQDDKTEEAIHDEAVKALARKVSVAVDAELAGIMAETPSRVTVTLADGRTVEKLR